MGWKLKTLSVLLALVFLAATLWQLSLLIFAALVIPPIVRRSTRAESRESGKGRRFPARKAAAAVLILVSLVAFAEGGTLSPFIFGGLGLLLLGWGRIPGLSIGGSLKPVRNSVLLRTALNPLGWTAVAEVKPVTRDPGKALSGVGETLLIAASGTPAIRIAFRTTAFSEESAEERILKAMEKINRGIVPLGAYLLPLDSMQASGVLQEPLLSSQVSEEGWALALSTSAYDVLSVQPSKGFMRSFGVYRRAQVEHPGKPVVPHAYLRFIHPPLLWEVFKSLEGRVQWPNPDRYTAFLSSIFATSYEPMGSNIIDAGTPSPTSERVIVKSHSSPTVELSRAQLRAIMRIYSQGPPVVQNNQPAISSDARVVPEVDPEIASDVPEAIRTQ